MDPKPIVEIAIWHDISTALRFLWAYWFVIIGFAFNMLIAHAIIPSLVASGQLSPRVARLRPLFYLGALGILAVALLSLLLSMLQIGAIGRFWDRWWI
ncbi:MAG: hypothetical protein HY535_06900 [Chloroflexi bacterium]|nr:hypothetical protein [Chloroflexota bacterium]